MTLNAYVRGQIEQDLLNNRQFMGNARAQLKLALAQIEHIEKQIEQFAEAVEYYETLLLEGKTNE